MGGKIAIYLGSLLHDRRYEDILKGKDFILIGSSVFKEDTHPIFQKKIKYFDQQFNQNINSEYYYDLIKKILSDFNIPLLWSRFHRVTRAKYKSEISRFEFQLSLIHSSIKFINKYELNKVYFAYEAHNLATYIFRKVLIELGIETIVLKISPFPSRLFAVNENKNTFVENKIESSFELESFIMSKKFSKQKEKSNFEISYPLNKSIYYNYRYHKHLLNNSTDRVDIFKSSYIVFFLHYQPEQTTLPDGGIFVSQIEALKVLSKLCEKLNFNLIVREHFGSVKYFNHNWRNISFINNIKDLGDHVMIDDFRESNQEILKKCRGVSTITGSVISEALINGIPAIAFGNHPFKGWNGRSLIQFNGSFSNLLSSFKIATQLKKKEIIKETYSYLLLASKKSFGGDFFETETGREKLKKTAYLQLVNIYKKSFDKEAIVKRRLKQALKLNPEIAIIFKNRHKALVDFINNTYEEN